MKKVTFMWIVFALATFVAACASQPKQEESERYAKKIYLTKEDYMEDLGNTASQERRDLPPNAESKYIFNVVPQQTEKAKNACGKNPAATRRKNITGCKAAIIHPAATLTKKIQVIVIKNPRASGVF